MGRLLRAISFLLLLVASDPSLAQGCGPTRLKVADTVKLDMLPAQAWALVGDFQNLSWDAETTGSSGTGGDTPDSAVRTVTFKGGFAMGESLYKYDANAMSYAYHVDRVDLAKLPVQNASGTLEVVAADGGLRSLVRWKFVFYRNLAPGEGAADDADAKAVEAMKRFLRAGLAGLDTRASPRT